MSTHLSRHILDKRLALGLKPSQLARLANCTNFLKSGNSIRQFEITGNISQHLFAKLVAVLKVDPATIERLVEQDRREFFEAWLKWVNQPMQPYLAVRLIPAVHSKRALPPHIATMDEAETWATSVARSEKRRACLVWSRRISCWFDEGGSLSCRTEAAPGEPNVPWMRIGGKTFTFGGGLGSITSVDWPKQPGK